VTPTLGLLTVLYIGLSPLKWAPGAAALVGLSLGYLFDLVSGAPRGVHAFVFLVMALFARALASRLAVRGVVLKAAAAFVASLLSAVLIVVVRAQVSPETGYGGLRQAPLEALLTAAFGPLCSGCWVVSMAVSIPRSCASGCRADGRAPRPRPAAPLISWISSLMDIAGQDAELPEIRHRARYLSALITLVFWVWRRGSSTFRSSRATASTA